MGLFVAIDKKNKKVKKWAFDVFAYSLAFETQQIPI